MLRKLSWQLYANRQTDNNLRINTFRDEHSCTLVWQNSKVYVGFLAKKYLHKFRLDPNLSMSNFMEIEKEDCMYEISKYQFDKTRGKHTSVVNELLEERYKIL